MRLRRWLSAVALAVLAAPLAGSQPVDSPPPPVPLLWKLSRADTTVYLLGSFHLLREDDYPLSTDVDAAFADAEKLLFEIAPDELNNPALASRMLDYARYERGQTLSPKVTPRMRRKLERLLQSQGIAAGQLDQYEPWFVNLSLVTALSHKLGYSSQYGLDQTLMRRASEHGKAMSGLETLEDQLRTLDQSPLDEQLLSLKELLESPEKIPAMLAELHGAWRSGDITTMDRLSREEMQDKTPHTYRLINVQRNHAWLPQIRALLEASGDDTLVVVGSLHLLGPDGLVEQLRSQGYRVERICSACAMQK